MKCKKKERLYRLGKKENGTLVGTHFCIRSERNLSRFVFEEGITSRSSFAQNVARRMVKHSAMPTAVGTNSEKSLRAWFLWTRYLANHLSATILLMAVLDGKAVSRRDLINQIGGFKLNSRPKIYLLENDSSLKDDEEEEAAVDADSTTIQGCDEVTNDENGGIKDCNGYKVEAHLRTISAIRRELPETTFGWPLLRRTAHQNWENLRRSIARISSPFEINISVHKTSDISSPKDESTIEGTSSRSVDASESRSTEGGSSREGESFGVVEEVSSSTLCALSREPAQSSPGWPLRITSTSSTTSEFFRQSEDRDLSVVQWVLSLPTRSKQATTETLNVSESNKVEISIEEDDHYDESEDKKTSLEAPRKLPNKLELVSKLKLCGCKRFNYEELKRATHQFSSENLIGEGGCSNVYKGDLPGGKIVAVKVLKYYKEAWDDFSLEVDITSPLIHKHITPLIGVCIEDNYLILVYDFLSNGSLEKSLHDCQKKSALPWKIRFKVAIAIAEALNYMHNECSIPVIHRDVKTSNILLSNEFQPQLSDFGLATWGPADSSYLIDSDVVGTFGYIAPEYIMHGRVSDKIDVYSFGVVLLELLTGRKPIECRGPNQQENLVKWATPLLETRNLKALLDPRADEDFDIVQMDRMILATTLCIKQSPRLRPTISQVLELLKGETDAREWMNSYINESSNQEVDDLFSQCSQKPELDLSFLDLDCDDEASVTSVDITTTSTEVLEGKCHLKLKDYLKEPQH